MKLCKKVVDKVVKWKYYINTHMRKNALYSKNAHAKE